MRSSVREGDDNSGPEHINKQHTLRAVRHCSEAKTMRPIGKELFSVKITATATEVRLIKVARSEVFKTAGNCTKYQLSTNHLKKLFQTWVQLGRLPAQAG